MHTTNFNYCIDNLQLNLGSNAHTTACFNPLTDFTNQLKVFQFPPSNNDTFTLRCH